MVSVRRLYRFLSTFPEDFCQSFLAVDVLAVDCPPTIGVVSVCVCVCVCVLCIVFCVVVCIFIVSEPQFTYVEGSSNTFLLFLLFLLLLRARAEVLVKEKAH